MNRHLVLPGILLFLFLPAGVAGGSTGALSAWLAAPFTETSTPSAGGTVTLFDSDEDRIVEVHRQWLTRAGEKLERGWAIGAAFLDSGQRSEQGAALFLDAVGRYPLLGGRPFCLFLQGNLGWQAQTIGYPNESHHNFRIGVALDWQFQVHREYAFYFRTGYFHVSNANLGGGNEGNDAFWLGAGLAW